MSDPQIIVNGFLKSGITQAIDDTTTVDTDLDHSHPGDESSDEDVTDNYSTDGDESSEEGNEI